MQNIDVLLERAAQALDRDDYDAAIAAYTRVIDQQRDRSEAYLQRGFAYLAVGERMQAIADFEETLKLTAENLDICRGFIEAVSVVGFENPDDVMVLVDAAISSCPDESLLYLRRAVLYQRLGDHEAA